MNKIIATKKHSGDFVCKITNFMDAYLKEEYYEWISKEYSSGTYLYYKEEKDDVPNDEKIRVIRFPGATRGHITMDMNNIIKSFTIYNIRKDIDCYIKNIETLLNLKYKGTKLIFEEGNNE